MSDDGQQFSIENQKAAILDYANLHGFEIVRTYADPGKSGLALKRRTGLRDLLNDVVTDDPGYGAILVYDVSRWGRFQNSDESAYYEFLCTRSGIPLHYCAEPFSNDASPLSSILKALKRSMAAEFSRELGVKVFNGKARLARLGFWVGGVAGYGLRRVMVSANGRRRQLMEIGEQKSLTSDRVILVRGPRQEVEYVRKMFQMALEGKGCSTIAREMNEQGFTHYGKPWINTQVNVILTSPKYSGCSAWNRRSAKLRGTIRRNPKTLWVTKEGAFAPIVDREVFEKVQTILRRIANDRFWTDEEIRNLPSTTTGHKGQALGDHHCQRAWRTRTHDD